VYLLAVCTVPVYISRGQAADERHLLIDDRWLVMAGGADSRDETDKSEEGK
jgi:hypothetical protein